MQPELDSAGELLHLFDLMVAQIGSKQTTGETEWKEGDKETVSVKRKRIKSNSKGKGSSTEIMRGKRAKKS